MSVTVKDHHSRTSSETQVPDLEKGEARQEEQEEEILQEKVCYQDSPWKALASDLKR